LSQDFADKTQLHLVRTSGELPPGPDIILPRSGLKNEELSKLIKRKSFSTSATHPSSPRTKTPMGSGLSQISPRQTGLRSGVKVPFFFE